MKFMKRFIIKHKAAAAVLFLSVLSAAGLLHAGGSSADRKTRILNSPQYSSDAGKFVNAEPVNLMSSSGFFKVLKEYWGLETIRIPKHKLPEEKPDLLELEAANSDIRFMWFGHSTVLLEVEGKRILLDPVFSQYASPVWTPKRFQPPVYSVDEIKNIDAVIISHDHYDHLDSETIKKLKKRPVHFIVPLGVGAHLEGWGIESGRITELDWWEKTELKGLTVTSTPARHFSGRSLFDRNETLWSSWAIKGLNRNVFFSGDGGYGKHFKEIGERLGPFDLTFMENGQYNIRWKDVHSLPHETIQAHIDLKGKAMVPIHWAMFELSMHDWFEPIVRASYEAKKRDVNLMTPKLGQLVQLDGKDRFTAWWQPYLPSGYLARHENGRGETYERPEEKTL